jgi:hypothetical protein
MIKAKYLRDRPRVPVMTSLREYKIAMTALQWKSLIPPHVTSFIGTLKYVFHLEPLNISATLRTEKNNRCVRKLICPQRVWDSPQEVRDSPKEVRDSVRTENIPWSPRAKGHCVRTIGSLPWVSLIPIKVSLKYVRFQMWVLKNEAELVWAWKIKFQY